MLEFKMLNLEHYTKDKQYQKVTEEYIEFVQARDLHKLEEAFDVIQALIGWISKHDMNDVININRLFAEKLEKRSREGMIEIIQNLKLS